MHPAMLAHGAGRTAPLGRVPLVGQPITPAYCPSVFSASPDLPCTRCRRTSGRAPGRCPPSTPCAYLGPGRIEILDLPILPASATSRLARSVGGERTTSTLGNNTYAAWAKERHGGHQGRGSCACRQGGGGTCPEGMKTPPVFWPQLLAAAAVSRHGVTVAMVVTTTATSRRR